MEQYTIAGMSCAACSARVEKAVSGVSGVTSCSVNLLTNSMSVDGEANEKDIIKAVEDAGYGAFKKDSKKTDTAHDAEDAVNAGETSVLKRRLIASVGFLLVLMYF